MIHEWVFGVLFRPGVTFERAKQQMRLDYWWIILSVITLNVVVTVYRPVSAGQEPVPVTFVVIYVTALLLLFFDLQALMLMGAARLFNWTLAWGEAVRFVGFIWSVHLLEHLLTFPLAVRGNLILLLWLGIPFLIWYLIAMTIGVRQLSGMSTLRAFSLSTLATIPWQAALYWVTWISAQP